MHLILNKSKTLFEVFRKIKPVKGLTGDAVQKFYTFVVIKNNY